MLSTISADYVDTCAAQLSLQLGLPLLDAYAELAVPLAEGGLDLRLLGHSHQVVLRAAGALVCETVGCLAGDDHGLPSHAQRAFPAADYRFRSQVRLLAPGALTAEACRLVKTYADQAAALVGVFPGSPSAVTAVAARPLPHGIGWRTWHVYPQTGEVVETSSSVLRRRPP